VVTPYQITESEFAQRLANDVVPRWALIQSTLERDRVDDNLPGLPRIGCHGFG